MIDFGAWKEKEVKVASLMLDALNPRTPDVGHQPSQAEIIAALVEHEEIYELAKGIVERGGLYPSELLVGVEEDGEKVIVEGNRRLAALKLLENPTSAPESKQKSFRLLKERIPPQNVEKVKVTFAPSREAAAPLIVDRHTGTALRRWARGQQAKYIRTLVGPGNTIDDVAKQIGMSRSEIVAALRMDTMLQVARVAPLKPEVQQTLEDPRRFNFSTLERLIESKDTQKFLGIEFDGDGGLVGHVDENEFKRGYARMISDIVKPVSEGGVDTRSLNTGKDIQTYLSSFGKDTPNKQKKGVFTSTSLLSGKTQSSAAAVKAIPTPPVSPAVPRDSYYLVPRGFKFRLDRQRIKEIFVELRSLKIEDHPNSLAVMLRIFWEFVVGEYLEATGKIAPLLQSAQKKGKAPDWYPTLKQMMAAVLQDPDVKLPVLAKRALNRMINDDASLLSLEHVNQFVHSQWETPKDKELRRLWNMLEPLFVQLMDATVAASIGKQKKTK